MKLKPTQIIGLVAIVVFGGGMIFRLTQPSEREIMDQRMASLPRVEIPAVEFPIPDLQYTIPPAPGSEALPALSTPAAPTVNYTAAGSQDARDDLYCSSVLSMEFDVTIENPGTSPDAAAKLLNQSQALKGAGLAKLKSEGASTGDDWAFFTSAYDDLVQAEHGLKPYRIPASACAARADALPADSPPPP
jgi:hypothetical protein